MALTTVAAPTWTSGHHVFTGLLILLAVSGYAQAQEVEPKNIVGIFNKPIRLECPTPNDVVQRLQWVDYVYNANRDPKLIFDAADNREHRVSQDHPRRKDYVVGPKMAFTIRNVTMDDAGIYFCRLHNADDTYTELHRYSLAVVGMPKCSGETMLTEGDSTELQCRVLSNSNELPVVDWITKGAAQSTDDHSDLDAMQKNLQLTDITADNDKQTYSCNVSIAGKSEDCHLTLDVKYAVRDIKISPMKDSYNVGDTIKCEARGNPEPTIDWSPEVNSNKQGSGYRSFTITPEMQDKKQMFKCTASNMVGIKTELLEQEIVFTPKGSDGETKGPEATSPQAEPKPIEVLDTEAPRGAITNGAAAYGVLGRALLAGLVAPLVFGVLLCATASSSKELSHGAAILILSAILATGPPKMGIIIGIAAGALLVIIIVIAAIVIARKKSSKKKGHMQIPTTEQQHDWKTPTDTQGGSPDSRTPKGADRNSNGVTSSGRYPAYVTSTPQDRDPDTPWRRQSEAV